MRQAVPQTTTVMTSPIVSPRMRGMANPTVLSAENVATIGQQPQLAEMLQRSAHHSADKGEGHRRGRSVSQVRPFASTAREKVAIHDPDILAAHTNAQDAFLSPGRNQRRQQTAEHSFTVRGHKADRYARVNLKTQAAARANSHTMNGFEYPKLKHMEVSDQQ